MKIKELRYEIENNMYGLMERYVIIYEDGSEEVKSEKKLDTSDMLSVFNSRMSEHTIKIEREE